MLCLMQVILSEGGLSSLANMKLNLELNQLNNRMDDPGTTNQDPNLYHVMGLGKDPSAVEADLNFETQVKCIFLPWESAEESELQNFMPDIILGADVIYNPLCLPHLIRVLATLLNQTRSSSPLQQDNCVEFSPDSRCIMDARAEGADIHNHDHGSRSTTNADGGGKNSVPVAYIASVIRNIETFNYFLALAEEANLDVKDLTEQSSILESQSPISEFSVMGDPGNQEIEVIHSWSAPRSISTGLMYSFAQRDDFEVLDEPLYANFLRVTGVERPYREELLSKMESDGNKVVKEIIFGPGGKKYRFCKVINKFYHYIQA
ncbi:Branched-chain-amino-acid aminotransferase-like protein 2 [Vitis vinifera]|uniref:Branched-chain-amino-acid aminotransferase-like protein 2 n=1 Tax=Vitis vinifera TaxID=29760 RepID=A0A438KCI0_VITVI|nr:Branched-chain-amino-acid aminotransferase-like protein 2 [Vitis vinifera]